MEIRNSKSCTLDLNYDELGVIERALESYVCGDLNDCEEFGRAKILLLDIHMFLC